jgi:hypothetical protein
MRWDKNLVEEKEVAMQAAAAVAACYFCIGMEPTSSGYIC